MKEKKTYPANNLAKRMKTSSQPDWAPSSTQRTAIVTLTTLQRAARMVGRFRSRLELV